MRLKMVFVAAVFALAVVVPVASAEKPIKVPAPSPAMFTGPVNAEGPLGRIHHLRVLIANQRADRLELLGRGGDRARPRGDRPRDPRLRRRRGHGARAARRGARRARASAEHALHLISEIVGEAFCPVIALLDTYDAVWVNEAAKRGVFAYIVDSTPKSCRARSTSPCGVSASTSTCKERSTAGTPRTERDRAQGDAAAACARAPRGRRAGARRRPARPRARPARRITGSRAGRAREHPRDRQQILDELRRKEFRFRTDPRHGTGQREQQRSHERRHGSGRADLRRQRRDAMLLGVIVERKPQPEVVGEAPTANEAIVQATRLQPSVILLDLAMPDRSGLDALPDLAPGRARRSDHRLLRLRRRDRRRRGARARRSGLSRKGRTPRHDRRTSSKAGLQSGSACAC